MTPDVSMHGVVRDLATVPSAFQGAFIYRYAGESLTPDEQIAWDTGRVVAQTLAADSRILSAPQTEWVLCVGRQGGKSSIVAPCIVAWSVLNAPQFGVTAQRPGNIVIVTPVTRQGKNTLNAVVNALERHPVLSTMITAKRLGQDDAEVEFSNYVTVRILPANPRTCRGYSCFLILADEVDHFIAEAAGENSWTNVFDALRPGTVAFTDARVLKVSSPAGTDGPMFADKVRAESGDDSLVFFHATTEQMSPVADRKMLARERARNSQHAAREYDAAFLDSAGRWIFSEEIERAQQFSADTPVEVLYAELKAEAQAVGATLGRPVLALDLSNKNDNASYALACTLKLPNKKEVEAIVLQVKAFNKQTGESFIDPRICVTAAFRAAKAVGARKVVSDQILEGFVAAIAKENRIPYEKKFTGTEAAKAKQMFNDVQQLFRTDAIAMPRDKETARELGGLEDRFEVMRSTTKHDDRAVALIAAAHEAVFGPQIPEPWFFSITT